MAYESTSVTPAKSQQDIRAILTKHDASGFRFSEHADHTDDRWWLTVEFVKDDHLVRIAAPVNGPDEKWLKDKVRRARTKKREDFVEEHREQEVMRVWRVLYWSLKARMESIDNGLETFVQAFLPHVVDPGTGQTLWQRMHPHIEDGSLRLGGSGLPGLPMTTGGSDD